MASNSNSVLSRQLSVEDRQWLAALQQDQGWLLLRQAMAELLEGLYKRLARSDSFPEIRHLQGEIDGIETVMKMPGRLAASSEKRPQQS